MFAENLRRYREELGLTREEVAYRLREVHGLECTGANVQNWEKGTNPKIEAIVALADVLGVPEQFLFDDSPRAVNKIIDKELPNFNSFTEHTKRVPLVDGYVGAGSAGYLPALGEQNIIDYLYVDNQMIEKRYRDRPLRGLIVIGDSMQPYVSEKDIVLFAEIDPATYRLSDGKYIIETINGVMVKNLRFTTTGDIVISSCNRAYSEEVIRVGESQERLDIIGVVVGRVLKN